MGHEKKRNIDNSGKRHKTLAGVLCLLAVGMWAATTTPQRPLPPRDDPNKVYLLNSDELTFDKEQSADYRVLRGNVVFRKDSMYMYCDSAYFYEKDNSLDAFGNVHMEQGDTLFIYGDVLYYNGNEQIARLRENVRMENRDVTLFTDSLNYEMIPNIGYYFDGGKLVDSQNELSSVYGQYSPDTKQSVFNFDVQLVNEKYTLYSDTLEYNTQTKIADIVGPSTIVSDSNIIYSTAGWYNTETDKSMLLKRSLVTSKGQSLTGDTIYYDRRSGFGEVFGNMVLNDSVRSIIMEGQYGFYNERTEYSFATDSARVLEFSRGDTLYLHADTLKSHLVLPDSTRLLQAYHGVRFFRVDAQGVCDSMEFTSADSLLHMYKLPIIWNENYQITGDTIRIHMNDSAIDWAYIPAAAFATQHKDSVFFDQVSGKTLKAWFDQGQLRQVDVSGNAQTIFYPQERDSTLTGLNKAESGFLTMYLKDQKMEKIIIWPQPQGSLTPMEQVKPDQLYLPAYKWYSELRPTSPDDIFRKPEVKVEVVEEDKKKHRFGR